MRIEDLMVHLAGIREERKAVITVSEGWRLYRRDSELGRPLEAANWLPVTSCCDRRARRRPIPRSCRDRHG